MKHPALLSLTSTLPALEPSLTPNLCLISLIRKLRAPPKSRGPALPLPLRAPPPSPPLPGSSRGLRLPSEGRLPDPSAPVQCFPRSSQPRCPRARWTSPPGSQAPVDRSLPNSVPHLPYAPSSCYLTMPHTHPKSEFQTRPPQTAPSLLPVCKSSPLTAESCQGPRHK